MLKPLSLGAVHSMAIEVCPVVEVVGASGFSGATALRVMLMEVTLFHLRLPSELTALTATS